MASWIEMKIGTYMGKLAVSRLMWPRGLKYSSKSSSISQRKSRLMWPRGLK